MMHFLEMGKYARYVWPAYGIVFTVTVLNVVWARQLLSRARSEARRRLTVLGDAS
jgi:heme exporter protein CcmD